MKIDLQFLHISNKINEFTTNKTESHRFYSIYLIINKYNENISRKTK